MPKRFLEPISRGAAPAPLEYELLGATSSVRHVILPPWLVVTVFQVAPTLRVYGEHRNATRFHALVGLESRLFGKYAYERGC